MFNGKDLTSQVIWKTAYFEVKHIRKLHFESTWPTCVLPTIPESPWPAKQLAMARPWLGCGQNHNHWVGMKFPTSTSGTSPLFAGWITIEWCWTSIFYGWIMNSDNSHTPQGQLFLGSPCGWLSRSSPWKQSQPTSDCQLPLISSSQDAHTPEVPLSEIGCTSKLYILYIYTRYVMCIYIHTLYTYIRIWLICKFICVYYTFSLCVCVYTCYFACLYMYMYTVCVSLTPVRFPRPKHLENQTNQWVTRLRGMRKITHNFNVVLVTCCYLSPFWRSMSDYLLCIPKGNLLGPPNTIESAPGIIPSHTFTLDS